MIMKKYILFVVIFSLFFISCTKTDVDIELENARNSERLLTDEEYKILDKEDSDFQHDYLDDMIEATEENKITEDYNLVRELEDLEDLKKSGKWWKFSCDAIKESSTCIEYYGSFWQAEHVKMGCRWIFSSKSCPIDTIWWCNTGVWTMADMVVWMYLRGDWWITEESVKHAKNACDATMMSNWIAR